MKKCDRCQKIATYNSVLIVDGYKTEVHFCNDCAISVGLINNNKVKAIIKKSNDLSISEAHKNKDITEVLLCINCGMREVEYVEYGLAGCEKCYEYFREVVLLNIKKLNNDYENKALKVNNKLIALKKRLSNAIIDERYEDAAKINLEIKKIN